MTATPSRPSVLLGCLLGFLSVAPLSATAQEGEAGAEAEEGSKMDAEALAAAARDSLVTITTTGRGGEEMGEGSGFVLSEDGLIATNLHVIGEGRPITATLSDGSAHRAVEVHASNHLLDLAIIRIDAEGLELKALPLGDPENLAQGERVVAMGNPQGLEFSIVEGLVSAVREVGGREMIQLAMPIEPGNSGGPLLDMTGQVHGVITMKSAITENLGFAVPAEGLARLLADPNPVPADQWLTIGALDPARWESAMGSTWTQHHGQIEVAGQGTGFGGRSLCRSLQPAPGATYQIATEVRVEDDDGAAGIFFGGDGGDHHYGFYPTSGQIRLTRFEGPLVMQWTILETVDCPAYRPGEWNRLRAEVGEDSIRCFVNGELTIEVKEMRMDGLEVGLCKFRHTRAAFRRFAVGDDLSPPPVPEELVAAVEQLANSGEPLGAGQLSDLAALATAEQTGALLRRQAEAMEGRAEELRRLAVDLHAKEVARELGAEMAKGEGEIDLARAALIIARHDRPDLDVDAYLESIDRMAAEVSASVPEKVRGKRGRERRTVEALSDYLFSQRGFHGSDFDYYNPANSSLASVIDDREGLPITLAVLYLEIGRRAGAEGLIGIPLPGHFLVAHRLPEPEEGEHPTLIDVFDHGEEITLADAAELVESIAGIPFDDAMLEPADKRQIVLRILRNLIGVSVEETDPRVPLGYLDLFLAVDPDSGPELISRAFLRYRSGDEEGSAADLRHVLEVKPEGIDLNEVRRMLSGLE